MSSGDIMDYEVGDVVTDRRIVKHICDELHILSMPEHYDDDSGGSDVLKNYGKAIGFLNSSNRAFFIVFDEDGIGKHVNFEMEACERMVKILLEQFDVIPDDIARIFY